MDSDQSHDRGRASEVDRMRGSKRRKLTHPQQKSPDRLQLLIKASASRRRRISRRLHPEPPREMLAQNSHRPPSSKNQSLQMSTAVKLASSKSNSPIPTPTPDSGTKLFATKSILDQIWIRNKNQHRTQSWSKSLILLRKAVTKVVDLEEEERLLRGQINGGGAIGGMDAKEIRKRFEQETQVRREKGVWTDWIREMLVPRAYVGFTGLVGDSQFANLGVVLVGILGDVMSAVGPPTILDEEEESRSGVVTREGEKMSRTMADEEYGKTKARSPTTSSLRVTGLQSGEIVGRMYDGDDFGEVVERRKDKNSEQGNDASREEDAAAPAAPASASASEVEDTHIDIDAQDRNVDGDGPMLTHDPKPVQHQSHPPVHGDNRQHPETTSKATRAQSGSVNARAQLTPLTNARAFSGSNSTAPSLALTAQSNSLTTPTSMPHLPSHPTAPRRSNKDTDKPQGRRGKNRGTKGKEKESDTKHEKERIKSMSKSKKKNAIDDVFAGFL
ncbi:uncharacterized protein Z518_01455 [Rhinocladiella mackenziei CBS 650.93]|uniref:RNase MRP protein 1 RNA binding domain-containing protein n=1 Tax=Rhinocladiella mackenziei CBS 650.93 TaxID=1442369 RepID=A0A0D2HI57_9EURO|nr:uncharacterized protein Z518_01455 [Rhinocladiella mackenziei CBS 650.93]KIX10373.1 hypothetical protein Z518_01455 [Rhinocladiella mackenziei CBS 650.93]